MRVERTDRDRRARVHAALAEPIRLRLVDLLGDGDLSPSELQAALGIGSNLLAHHVGILEQTGLVRRRRSDADRRRTYLHLVPEATAGLLARPEVAAPRVVFVCTANSARSQLAASLWRAASQVAAASAGTRPADRVAAGALAVARRHGLLLGGHPRALSDVVRPGDHLITVCDSAREEIASLAPQTGSRPASHWSIADPVRQATDAAFEDAFEELAQRVADLAPRVHAA